MKNKLIKSMISLMVIVTFILPGSQINVLASEVSNNLITARINHMSNLITTKQFKEEAKMTTLKSKTKKKTKPTPTPKPKKKEKPTPKPTAKPTPKPTATPTPKPTSTPTPTPTVSPLTPQQYSEMVDRSLVSIGNNKRFQAAVEKAKKGDNVTIAWLGGSITQGVGATLASKNFASIATKSFADKYAKDPNKVTCVNAGIAGTPSTLGILRCNADIISYKPDIVFVEYAVNDGTDDQSREMYESVVRKLLNSPNAPAVVLLFTLTKDFYSAQDVQAKIGSYYDLGMISVKDAIVPEIQAGRMKFLKDYAADAAHPNNTGNAIIADFISNYFDKAATKTTDTSFEVPNKPYERAGYENLENIVFGSTAITDLGNFKENTNVNCFTYKNGWIKSTDAANKPMVIKQTFTKMLISYKVENKTDVGNVDVYIDGEKVATLTGYDKNGWGQVNTNLIYKSDGAPTEHTVELKMASGDESKKFTLLGIGYVK